MVIAPGCRLRRLALLSLKSVNFSFSFLFFSFLFFSFLFFSFLSLRSSLALFEIPVTTSGPPGSLPLCCVYLLHQDQETRGNFVAYMVSVCPIY